MAVTTQEKRVTCSIKLNAGTSETGARITKSVSLGTLKAGAFDAQKAYNIAMLLGPLLNYSIYQIENSVTNILSESA